MITNAPAPPPPASVAPQPEPAHAVIRRIADMMREMRFEAHVDEALALKTKGRFTTAQVAAYGEAARDLAYSELETRWA